MIQKERETEAEVGWKGVTYLDLDVSFTFSFTLSLSLSLSNSLSLSPSTGAGAGGVGDGARSLAAPGSRLLTAPRRHRNQSRHGRLVPLLPYQSLSLPLLLLDPSLLQLPLPLSSLRLS